MRPSVRRWPVVLLSIVAMAGCAKRPMSADEPARKLAGTSYYQSGQELFLAADVRASRIAGPANYLPVMVAINKKTTGPWYFTRESFVLETPDGRLMPLATYDEFVDNYRRERVDRQMSEPFLEVLATEFPEPPFAWLDIEMFPQRGVRPFPRVEFDLRKGQLGYGYLYFPLPESPPTEGRYKLLVTPSRIDRTFVLDFPPFEEDKQR